MCVPCTCWLYLSCQISQAPKLLFHVGQLHPHPHPFWDAWSWVPNPLCYWGLSSCTVQVMLPYPPAFCSMPLPPCGHESGAWPNRSIRERWVKDWPSTWHECVRRPAAHICATRGRVLVHILSVSSNAIFFRKIRLTTGTLELLSSWSLPIWGWILLPVVRHYHFFDT